MFVKATKKHNFHYEENSIPFLKKEKENIFINSMNVYFIENKKKIFVACLW